MAGGPFVLFFRDPEAITRQSTLPARTRRALMRLANPRSKPICKSQWSIIDAWAWVSAELTCGHGPPLLRQRDSTRWQMDAAARWLRKARAVRPCGVQFAQISIRVHIPIMSYRTTVRDVCSLR